MLEQWGRILTIDRSWIVAMLEAKQEAGGKPTLNVSSLTALQVIGALLANGFDVYAPDLPGMDKSSFCKLLAEKMADRDRRIYQSASEVWMGKRHPLHGRSLCHLVAG